MTTLSQGLYLFMLTVHYGGFLLMFIVPITTLLRAPSKLEQEEFSEDSAETASKEDTATDAGERWFAAMITFSPLLLIFIASGQALYG